MKMSAGLVAALSAALLFTSCSNSSNPAASGIDSKKEYNLSVKLTDKPMMSLQAVMVTISAVRVHQSSSAGTGAAGWREIPVTAGMPVDLMQLRGGVVQELCREQLEPGTYQQVRLQLVPNEGTAPPYNNSVTMMNGTVGPIDVPGESIKIVHPFTVAPGGTTDLVMDFDAARSCRQRGNETWYMQPVVTATSHMN
ncbi:MAG: DUF4382 domain-containing protein [Candidatus Methylomirabilia bacterium]